MNSWLIKPYIVYCAGNNLIVVNYIKNSS